MKNGTVCKLVTPVSEYNGKFVVVKGIAFQTDEGETFYIVELIKQYAWDAPVFSNGYSCISTSEKCLKNLLEEK